MYVPQSAVRPCSLAISIASALGLSGAFILPAHAQQGDAAAAQGAPSLEEVVVTGSRIVRRDYESNSPIVTVNSEDFETQTGLNVESYLNQLPQYNPAASPVTSDGDVQITPVNSVGIASISLRGFGANRSLVLVDGKRVVPINPLMVTDVNAIPSALIERVETITGGASAVYGADAVGGVTNFILKDDFEGFDIDMQTGMTAEGDGAESRVSAVLGTNFDQGRGNVTIGVEGYKREASYEADHDIYHEWWARRDTGGTFGLQGVNGYSCANDNCPDPHTVDALFADRLPGSAPFSPNGSQTSNRGFNFNPDGTIFTNSRGGLYRADGSLRYTGVVDGQEYALQNALDNNLPVGSLPEEFESLKWNHQRNYISAPQDRYSFFASGNFQLTDKIQAFARATFAESNTRTILFGTNAITGWEGTVAYDPTVDSPVDPNADWTDPSVVADYLANPTAYANPNFIATGQPGAQHPVPAQLAILLNSREPTTYCLTGSSLPGGSLPCGTLGSNTTPTDNPALVGTQGPQGRWQPQWNPDDSLPPRNTFNTNEQWQVETGLNFDIGADWTGELYFSHGESATYNVAGGNLSLERYRQLIDQPDYGRGAEISGNEPPNSTRPYFGAGDVTCTSGFYDTFFSGDQPLSDDCYQAVNATLQTRTHNEQNIIELNFQGPVYELPAGEVRMAAGYQSRRNSAEFYPDILQSEVSFTDQVIGVYPTGYLDASTSVDDYYIEGLIPVISGKKGAQRLELELGARYSDYEHTEAETTWKSLINWQATDWLRFRGGFNRATRAPNLGELFLNPQEIFTGGGSFGDACGLRSNAPYGAGGTGLDPVIGPGEDPSGETPLAAGQTAAGAQSARLICEALMGGHDSPAVQNFYYTSNAGGATGGGFAWVLQQGNPNLRSETADTWTWGMVARLPNNLTLSLDWYDVQVNDAIMLYSLTYAAYRCFGSVLVSTPEEAAAQAQSQACQLTPRDLNNGSALNALLSYDNQATIKTSGLDVALNWFKPLDKQGATLGFNVQATILDSYRTKTSPANFDVETEWKGSLGPTLTGTNGGAYDYRLFGSVNYSRDKWNVGLRWRHLPPVWTAGHASQEAIIENNESVAAGGPGILLSYTPSTEIKSNSYDVFDLSFGMNFSEKVSLRGGITNLFDTEPEVVGATTGFGTTTDLSSVCSDLGSPPGCRNPFGYSLPSAGSWNPGYYDTLGRRFFVGMSLRF
jgi:outer membrane receptor protein involved in Fe transport